MRSDSRVSGRTRLRVSDRGAAALSVVAILLVWEGAVQLGLIEARNAPPPSATAQTLLALTVDGFPAGVFIWQHVGMTVLRVVVGFALAAALAIPAGLLIGRQPLLERGTSMIVTFARSVAAISLLPLAVAVLGVGESSKIFIIAFACFWIILANAIEAAKSVDAELVHAARSLGVDARRLFWRVTLPATLPRVFTGCKVALGMAFLVIVAAEMIGTVTGLGALVMEARTFYRSDVAVAGMVVIGVVGLLLTVTLDRLEARLLPWSPAVVRGRS